MSTLYIYPGSFNPFHAGHAGVHALACSILGIQRNDLWLEFCTAPFGKDAVTIDTISDRVQAVKDLGYVPVVTGHTRLVDKVNALALTHNSTNAVVIIGADTLNRVTLEDFEALISNNTKLLPFARDTHCNVAVLMAKLSARHRECLILDQRALSYHNTYSSTAIRSNSERM